MDGEQEQDKSQKTQEPTPHRKEKAREKGQIPHSKEINHFFMISVFLALFWFGGVSLTSAIGRILKNWIAGIGTQSLDSAQLLIDCRELFLSIIVVLSVFFLFFVAAALAAGGIQGHFRFVLENIKPQLSRISLLKGFSKIFSLNGFMEFFKGILKLAFIISLAYLVLSPEVQQVNALSGVEPIGAAYKIQELTGKMLLCIVIAVAALAIADYTYQWFQNLKNLKMSHQELKDEQKHLEGDPLVKRRQRQKRSELADATQIAQTVPEATVVITNPLHYAVALKWNMTMRAPIVIAKGSDFIAFRIRDLAKEHFVPLIENPPLARVLHATVEIDQEIRPEHYKAVAEIIRYVLNIKQR
ncbi:MAG: EscU/YscU/HrcU family type III secretion system export apparatus switch protein [Alphaproteobacteria bacterium]